jgi:hypothetical protein
VRRGRLSTMRSRVAVAAFLLPFVAACGQQTGAPRAGEPTRTSGVSYLADGLPDWTHGVDRLELDLSRDELRFSAGCNDGSAHAGVQGEEIELRDATTPSSEWVGWCHCNPALTTPSRPFRGA